MIMIIFLDSLLLLKKNQAMLSIQIYHLNVTYFHLELLIGISKLVVFNIN